MLQVTQTLVPVPLSAASEDTLKAYAGVLAGSLSDDAPLAGVELSELTSAIAHRRDHFSRRAVFIAPDAASLKAKLEAFAKGEAVGEAVDDAPATVISGNEQGDRKIAFTFSGQGSQWWAMGRGLLENEPVYRRAVEDFDAMFEPLAGWSVVDAMMQDEASSQVDRSAVTQPTICALQIALAALWRHRGVVPDMVIGHSLGEVAAAHVAGAIDLETAVRYIHTRSLIGAKASGQGAMAVVGLPEDELKTLLPADGSIEIAGYNSPAALTITGDAPAIANFIATLNAERPEVMTRPVKTDTAWHSHLLEAGEAWFRSEVGEIAYKTPTIPFISTVTGRPERRLDTDYWWNNLRKPVRYSYAVGTAAALGANIFLELAPHRTLAGPTAQSASAAGSNPAVIVSLNRKFGDEAAMAAALGELYVRGVDIDWNAVAPGTRANIELPRYPWNNARYAKLPEEAELYLFEKASHPLLGRRLLGPTTAWRSVVNLRTFKFIADHRLREECLFPAAGYLEIMLAAGMEMYGKGPIELEGVKIYEAMFIRQESNLVVQTVYEADRSMLRIYSRGEERGAEWVLRSEGRVRQRDTVVPQGQPGTMANPIKFPREFWYANSGPQAFIEFGPMFQCVQSVTVEVNGYRAIGELAMPADLKARAKEYFAHPAMLDAGLQMTDHNIATLGAEIGSFSSDGRFIGNTNSIPTGIRRVVFLAPLTENMSLEVRHKIKDYLPIGNTGTFRDADGNALVVIEDVMTKRVPITSRAVTEEGVVTPDVLEEGYISINLGTELPAPQGEAARILVLASSLGRTDALVASLKSRGAAVETLKRSELETDDLAGVRALISSRLETGGPVASVIYGWSLDQAEQADDVEAEALLEAAERDIIGLTATGQVFEARKDGGHHTALVLLTRKARFVPGDGAMAISGVVQSALVGLARTIQTECETTPIIQIDLDDNALASPDLILAAMFGENREGEVVLRDGKALAPRVERREVDDLPARSITVAATDTKANYVITMKAPGVIDAVELRETDMPVIGEGEALLQIKAVGLNFRDVMAVTGLLPAEAEPDAAYRNLGLEYGAVVAAIGPGVTNVKVGDRVMGNYRRCLQRFIKLPAAALSKIPEHVSFEGAATVPTPFSTVHYGLNHVARLKKGERILIHVATGGVGLAAIQLAKRAGAEIFATAGNEEKRAYLRSLGIQHVMSSRNLDFADEIMRLTNGRGVDVILNSLPTAYIQKGLDILAPFGRFIEIGKRDVYADTAVGMKALRRNVQMACLDLANLGFDNPAFLGQLLSEVGDMLEAREIQPLMMTTFPASRITDAFRYMQQAKHMGKVVITFDEPEVRVKISTERAFKLDGGSSYLVTGGSRGFGIAVADWLSQSGAGRIVLASRSGKTDAEEEGKVAAIVERGTQVESVALDMTDTAAVASLVAAMASSDKPLKGIVHGAAVIEDAFLPQLDEELIHRVVAPKVAGVWNLHQGLAAAKTDVDFLVSFSSTSQLMGSRGQANYAAANAFLDAFANWRRGRGKPAFTVDWGPLGGSGFVARNEQLASYMASMGLHLVNDTDATSMMAKMLNVDRGSLAYTAIDWPKFRRTNAGIEKNPRLAPLVADTGGSKTRVRAELLALSRAEWPAQVAAFIRGEVAKVLKIDADAVHNDRPLSELGLDSLSSFELKSMIEDEMALQMSVSQFLQASTVDKLVILIIDIVEAQIEAAKTAGATVSDETTGMASRPTGRFAPSDRQQGLLAIEFGRLSTDAARAALRSTAEVHVTPGFEAAKVEEALAALAARHPMLRLHVESHGENTAPSLTLGEAPALNVHETRDGEVDRALNVAADELIRVHLVGTAPAASTIVVHAHAAALDRAALAMVAEELVALSAGAVTPAESTDADVFAALAGRRYDTEAAASISHRAYWTETLLPWTPELKFTERRRPLALAGLGRTQGERKTSAFKFGLAPLTAVPVAERQTLLFTAFGLALADVSGADGLIVECHSARAAGEASLAAPLGADLPVPFRFEPGTTAATQLDRARWQLASAEKHRTFDAHSIERVMRGEMLSAGQCPAQAVFTYMAPGTSQPILMEAAKYEVGGHTIEGGLAAGEGLLHDVALTVDDSGADTTDSGADTTNSGADTTAVLSYDADALDDAAVRRISQCLADRIAQLAGSADAAVSNRKARPQLLSAV